VIPKCNINMGKGLQAYTGTGDFKDEPPVTVPLGGSGKCWECPVCGKSLTTCED